MFSFQKQEQEIELSIERGLREISTIFIFSLEFYKAIVIGLNIEHKGVAYN